MGSARIGHSATLLGDGMVLVMGDTQIDGAPISAELYDPRSGRWAPTASPARVRSGYTATRLSDGTVLLVGDFAYGSQGSSQLYEPGSP
jgi:hypothetical protein